MGILEDAFIRKNTTGQPLGTDVFPPIEFAIADLAGGIVLAL